jgi:hypothetical protein
MVSENQTRSPRESILVDGHVHIHRCFDLQALFESAQQNFCDAASTLNLGSRFSAVLLLTESQGVDYFSSFLRKATDRSSVGGWRFQPTTEPDSLIAVSRAGFELTLIAGRQIATAERLEVLAVCTDKLFDDGGTIPVVIDSVSAANGVAIVPWGFAKRPFHLGDNSGRISVWREPPQFDLAKSQGQRIFRGTDPIPFPGQENRVGSFGFSISGPFNRSGPTASMRNLLASGNIQPTPYGVLETPMVFAKNQLKMQVRKLQRQMKSDPT